MAIVKINLEDLIIFEGVSQKADPRSGLQANKPYKFVKIDRRLANNSTFVEQLKAAGVRVNANKAAVQAQFAIIE